MSIDLVLPKEVELTTLLNELRKLSWAAADVLMAYARGQDVIYTPWFWKWILLIIRFFPERIFKRLSL